MMKYLIVLFILLFSNLTWAGSVTLEWDANTEPDLDGYKIYYKIGSSGEPYDGMGATEGSSPIDVGNVTVFTLNTLTDGSIYYFVATAYDTGNNESGYSNEVFAQIEPEIPDTTPPEAAFDLVAAFASGAPVEGTIFLDADTPATGSNLDAESLATLFGNITFAGEIVLNHNDPDMVAIGSLGAVFDVYGSAEISFDFDVASVSFIYGGNRGGFNIEARDINGEVMDSFFQADTGDGEPAGPITLTGPNIRSLYWQDPEGSFAPIDNVTITIGQ